MEDSRVDIGTVLRNERKKLGISLDEAANRTGVSKTMLGQIERGESSPTLATVWKIAAGLHISMSNLLVPAAPSDYHVTPLSAIEPLKNRPGGLTVYTLFPFNPMAPFDYLYIVMEPGVRYDTTTHANAQEEYLVITQGVLTMHVGEKIYTLGVGDSMSFAGYEKHTYENLGGETCIFQCIVHY